MEEVYHCAARPRRHFHMLHPGAHCCQSLMPQGPKSILPAWRDRAVTPRGIGLMARKCSGVNWPMYKNCQLNASWLFFQPFPPARCHRPAHVHGHSARSCAQGLPMRAPLPDTVGKHDAEQAHTSNAEPARRRFLCGPGQNTDRTVAMPLSAPRATCRYHKKYACAVPTSRCLPRPRRAVLADENTRP